MQYKTQTVYDVSVKRLKTWLNNLDYYKLLLSLLPLPVRAISKNAFSLVEMLMALLVASLLMAALAPVITKKFGEIIDINGSFTSADGRKITKEILYGSSECSEIKKDTDGSEYCEGEFVVPSDMNKTIKVTVIGAGGGGGTAPTAGYTEYTTIGNHLFKVPAMVGSIEATLVSGGAGGGAGGQIEKTQTFVTYGNGNITADSNNIVTIASTGTGKWKIPEAIKNKQILATACGGGGGGGCTSGSFSKIANSHGYGGGSGGYIINQLTNFGNASEITYYIGGGGGGAQESRYNAGDMAEIKGLVYGGGSVAHDGGTGADGALITSSIKGGGGGTGIVGTCGSTTICNTNWSIPKMTKGGNGGSPDGGNGAALHGNPCYSGKGGGGGGASQLVIGSGIYLNAPGGGGGGGSEQVASTKCPHSAGGGGGGGAGGGAGGTSGSLEGKSGAGGANAAGIIGGSVATIFGNNYCNGGNSANYINETTYSGGYTGKSGAIRLKYIDYGSGGSGGGGGAIVPVQLIKVNNNETLSINIGVGGKGRKAGYLDTAAKKIIGPENGKDENVGQESHIARNSTILLKTNNKGAYGAMYGCSDGTVRNSKLLCGNIGWISNGIINSMQSITISGFSNGFGKTAGSNNETEEENKLQWGDKIFSPKTSGGNGGYVNIFNGEIKCEGGKGGTQSSPEGKSASGYGCGGGGGWAFSNGGNGSGGYARISWNKYWDATANSYRLAQKGAGGGGASGNMLISNMNVISGQVIKVRIGKGGSGAKVVNNEVIPAQNGGITIFGDSSTLEIRAGGGGGGGSSLINDNGDIINGAGGKISSICHQGSKNYLNNANYCTRGAQGYISSDGRQGGKGAAFINYGNGGSGGVQDTGDNANGKYASGFASGGGGAAIRDFVSKIDSSNILNNPNTGGNGANGKIILEWWEI